MPTPPTPLRLVAALPSMEGSRCDVVGSTKSRSGDGGWLAAESEQDGDGQKAGSMELLVLSSRWVRDFSVDFCGLRSVACRSINPRAVRFLKMDSVGGVLSRKFESLQRDRAGVVPLEGRWGT